ncbi:uncharacterized protein [Amphiura filiformis]|uniref:uncharacterized protein n=1 Tax=Amphiura filiformis TaxID=82378 RepID=UPI003B20BB8E
MDQLFGMILVLMMTILQATQMTVLAAGCKSIFVAVNSASIRVEYQTRKLGNNVWSLRAQISWTRPSNPAFDGYAVQLNPVGSSRYGTCAITKDYVTTRNESIVFDDLKFGYQYEFVIHVAQLSIDTMSFIKRTKLSWAPDCYEETQDKEFCINQEIGTVSKVIDARIDCILNDNVNLTAYMTWLSPLQVNGNLTKFDVRYGDESTHPSTWALCDAQFIQHSASTYHSCALDLEIGYNYSALIVAYAVNTIDGLLQSQPAVVNFTTHNLSPSTSYNKCSLDSTTPDTVDNQTTSIDAISSTLRNAIASTLRAHNTTLPWESDLLPEERARQQLVHATFLVLGVLVVVAIGHAIVVAFCYIRRRYREDRVRAEIDKECYMGEVNCDDCDESKKNMLAHNENALWQNKSSLDPKHVPLSRMHEYNEVNLTSV